MNSSPNVEQNNAPSNPGGVGNTQVTYTRLDLSTSDVGGNTPIPTLPAYIGFPKIIKAF